MENKWFYMSKVLSNLGNYGFKKTELMPFFLISGSIYLPCRIFCSVSIAVAMRIEQKLDDNLAAEL